MSKVTIKRINQNIGAEVHGADLTQPLTELVFQKIYEAWVAHEVLIFRNQPISVDNLIAFGERFGELSIHPFSPNMDDRRQVIILDNHSGNPPALTDQWHSDETFRQEPPTGTILWSEISPEIGGDTLFASMTAAYAGLTPRMQHYLSGLTAIHDFKPFRTLFANRPEKRAQLRQMEDDYPNPSHPVVRKHPISSRPILNVNPQFTTRINDISPDESEMLLAYLYKQATVPEYQLRVRWEPHTLVMWDNRSVQHYASHDYYPQRRRMLRVTIKGETPLGIEDAMAGISPIARLADRREGLKSEVGEMVTRESERAPSP